MFVVKNAGAFRDSLVASPNFYGANNLPSEIRYPSSAAPPPDIYSNILENDRMFSPAPRYSLHPQLATVSTIQFSTTDYTD
jgi:hypothetical protein